MGNSIPGCDSRARSVDVFYSGLVGLYLARVGAADDEAFKLVPPSADGHVEPVRFRPRGVLNEDSEILSRGGSGGECPDPEHCFQSFLDLPHRFQHARRVVCCQDLGQALCPVLLEGVAGAQEQHPVRHALSNPRPRGGP
jgi:hypothetical protein